MTAHDPPELHPMVAMLSVAGMGVVPQLIRRALEGQLPFPGAPAGEELSKLLVGVLFSGTAGLPLRISQQQKNWQGSTMHFSLTAKMGLLSTPIKGYVEVTDKDVTVDADLGILERMIPAKKAQEVLAAQVHGLLK